MLKAPIIKSPPKVPLPHPSSQPQWFGEVKFRLPSSSTIFSTYFEHLFYTKIHLWAIAMSIASDLFDQDDNHIVPSTGQVLNYCARLKKWYAALPNALQPRRIVTPHQLQLQ